MPPAGGQGKLAACAAITALATGCASSDPGAQARLEPVRLTLPGDEPPADASRGRALADRAARDVADLAGLAGPVGPGGIEWLTPANANPANASPDRPAPVRHASAPAGHDARRKVDPGTEPEPVMISTFDDGPVVQVLAIAAEPAEPVEAVEPATGIDAGPLPTELAPALTDLSRILYRQASAGDAPMRSLLLIAATTMIDPAQALATDAIPGLTDRERELLGMFQQFFTNLGERLGTTGDPEVAVEAVGELGRTLSAAPALSIARAALCTRVGGFGDYDEFATNDAGRYSFLAQSSQQAIVYVELVDFTSTLNDAGQWVTELAQQVVVYSDRDGIPVQRVNWQPGVDVTRNRRGDFFLVQIITLADRLSVGRYQLKIRVRDEAASAEAETALEFELVADPQLASRG